MRCPSCACPDDKVVDTRISKDGAAIRRRRECASCGARLTTYEAILRAESVIVKRDGRREDFSPEKLRSGLQHACWKRPISEDQIDSLVKTISARLAALQQREVASHVLGQFVVEALCDVDHVAYVRFASVYRRFEDVGEFLSEIENLKDSVEG